VARAEACLRAKFHLDPSNRLATVHERHRQTDRQTGQRTESIGRTVLQTVAQKGTSLREKTSYDVQIAKSVNDVSCARDEVTKKERKTKETLTVANWVFSQTTHVLGSKSILHGGSLLG